MRGAVFPPAPPPGLSPQLTKCPSQAGLWQKAALCPTGHPTAYTHLSA